MGALPEERIKIWVDEADALFGSLLPLHRILSTYDGLGREEKRVLGLLLTACSSSSGSQLILVEHGKLSDAEIVCRTVLEGTLKVAYLLHDKSKIGVRCSEFMGPLFDFARIKDHFHALAMVEGLGLDQVPLAIQQLIMPTDEAHEMTTRYSKATRKSIEEAWSVTSILRLLSSDNSNPASQSYLGLYRSYAVGSHVTHVDYYGIISMREREDHPESERIALDLSHAARLISDVLSYTLLRLMLLFTAVDADLSPLVEPSRAVNAFQAMLNETHEEFESIIRS